MFQGLVSYKNGVKGAIATQVGMVQFRDFAIADNGAGPVMHIVNGKVSRPRPSGHMAACMHAAAATASCCAEP